MHKISGSKLFLGSLALSGLALAGCNTTTSGHVSYGVYYDSMMWNDYYRPRPPTTNPPPGRPVHPIAPAPPARPTPPIHRPRPR
ncbi:hypothetical protein [Shimia sediminis]|uniref:hypothetical protein n=1 Tax=Shimia sediminis TaxID=2497945 RepID=UPI000F8C8FD7|nr:hypothetical protein [Shimia sediminis]